MFKTQMDNTPTEKNKYSKTSSDVERQNTTTSLTRSWLLQMESKHDGLPKPDTSTCLEEGSVEVATLPVINCELGEVA
jgi:hypothetical protein